MCSLACIEKPNCNPRSHSKMGVFIFNGCNSWESADDAASLGCNRFTSARSSTGRVSSSLKVFIASTGRYTYCGRLPLVSIESRFGCVRRSRRYSICEGPRYYGVIGERTGTIAMLRAPYKILSRTFLPVNYTKYVL